MSIICYLVCITSSMCQRIGRFPFTNTVWISNHIPNLRQMNIIREYRSPLLDIHSVTVNTMKPIQNGRHFADDIFKCIFLNQNVWISLNISLKFVSKGPINNIPALIQIMVWCRQATSHYLNQWWLDYRRIYASCGLNELKKTCPSLPWRRIFL